MIDISMPGPDLERDDEGGGRGKDCEDNKVRD